MGVAFLVGFFLFVAFVFFTRNSGRIERLYDSARGSYVRLSPKDLQQAKDEAPRAVFHVVYETHPKDFSLAIHHLDHYFEGLSVSPQDFHVLAIAPDNADTDDDDSTELGTDFRRADVLLRRFNLKSRKNLVVANEQRDRDPSMVDKLIEQEFLDWIVNDLPSSAYDADEEGYEEDEKTEERVKPLNFNDWIFVPKMDEFIYVPQGDLQKFLKDVPANVDFIFGTIRDRGGQNPKNLTTVQMPPPSIWNQFPSQCDLKKSIPSLASEQLVAYRVRARNQLRVRGISYSVVEGAMKDPSNVESRRVDLYRFRMTSDLLERRALKNDPETQKIGAFLSSKDLASVSCQPGRNPITS